MRFIKAFIAGAVGLFVVITIFSLLIPSHVLVSRTVLIDRTNARAVYDQIANFENWKKWHPVFTVDAAKLYAPASNTSGKDAGFRILHRGKEVILTMLSADSGSIKFLLQSAGENDIRNDIIITALPSMQAVRVEWRATTMLRWYPWQKFYGIFIDKLTGPGYEAALKGLKEYVEGEGRSNTGAVNPALPPKGGPGLFSLTGLFNTAIVFHQRLPVAYPGEPLWRAGAPQCNSFPKLVVNLP